MDKLNLNKSSWKKVKFKDVAVQLTGKVDRENTELKYYVKGEHMSSEDIHIRQYGILEDEYLGPAFIRHFKEGDILYGSRRTYLKKVAIAHFEGITSNTTFVVNAKEDILDKRLLPFLMLSAGFTQHSITHSKGSVNPYINWKDLANYEFLLPPKEEQSRLAELLWAMDEVIEKDKELLEKVGINLKTKIDSLFVDSKKVKFIKFKELYKKHFKSVNPTDYKGASVLHYSLPSYLENKEPEELLAEEIKSNKLLLNRHTVLFSKLNPDKPKVWRVEPSSEKISLGSTEWLPLIPNEEISATYLEAFLSSRRFLHRVLSLVQGTSNSHQRIDPTPFYNYQLPILNEEKYREVERFYKSSITNIDNLESKISSSQLLQRSLINEVF